MLLLSYIVIDYESKHHFHMEAAIFQNLVQISIIQVKWVTALIGQSKQMLIDQSALRSTWMNGLTLSKYMERDHNFLLRRERITKYLVPQT